MVSQEVVYVWLDGRSKSADYVRKRTCFSNLVPRVSLLPAPARERERDPGWSWSRDSTRQTSPQSGYTRSIILFTKSRSEIFKRVRIVQSREFQTVNEAEVYHKFYNLNRSNLSTLVGTDSMNSTRNSIYSSLHCSNKYIFCSVK